MAAGKSATIAGNLTELAGGKVQIGATSAASYGKLTVTGTADLTASGAIDVKVGAGSTLKVGNVLAGVLTSMALTTGAITVTDNSPAVDFLAVVSTGGNTIDLLVVDKTPPVITLNGANPLTVALGSTFTDPGSTVTDNVDTGLVATVTGAVDTTAVGTYVLTYTATDAAGNTTTVTRTVNVTAASTGGGGAGGGGGGGCVMRPGTGGFDPVLPALAAGAWLLGLAGRRRPKRMRRG